MKTKTFLVGIGAFILFVVGVLLIVGGISDIIDLVQLDAIQGKPLAWAIVRIPLGLFSVSMSFFVLWAGTLIEYFDD